MRGILAGQLSAKAAGVKIEAYGTHNRDHWAGRDGQRRRQQVV
jgi:hypothetical protein